MIFASNHDSDGWIDQNQSKQNVWEHRDVLVYVCYIIQSKKRGMGDTNGNFQN